MNLKNRFFPFLLFSLIPFGPCFGQSNADAVTFRAGDFDKNEVIQKLKVVIKNKKVLKDIKQCINGADDYDFVSVNHFSTDIQSVVVLTESYAGASGSTNCTSFTFDFKTGKIYSLSDLFKPGVDWGPVLWPYIQGATASDGVTETEEIDPGDQQTYSLDPKYLYLHYGFCQLLPCVMARFYTVPIPLKDLIPYLKAEFLPESN